MISLVLITFAIIHLLTAADDLTPMNCKQDAYYVNDWDSSHDNYQANFFVSGVVDSVHNNHHEDRRWKWKYCAPNSLPNINNEALSATPLDGEWFKQCAGNSGITRLQSNYDNDKEDRPWTITCGQLDTAKFKFSNCVEQAVTPWDTQFNRYCPNNGVIQSIWSDHSNYKEDRIWKFTCCNLYDVIPEFGEKTGEWLQLNGAEDFKEHSYTQMSGTRTITTETISNTYSQKLSLAFEAGFTFKAVSAKTTITGERSSSLTRSSSSAFWSYGEKSVTNTCEKTYIYQFVFKSNEYDSSGNFKGSVVSYTNNFLCSYDKAPDCLPGECSTETDIIGRYGQIRISSGLCLDGKGLENSDNVLLWNCDDLDNKKWYFSEKSIKTSNNLCLDGTSAANGANVLLWSCSGNSNQQWEFVEIGDSPVFDTNYNIYQVIEMNVLISAATTVIMVCCFVGILKSCCWRKKEYEKVKQVYVDENDEEAGLK
eukprot:121668_1